MKKKIIIKTILVLFACSTVFAQETETDEIIDVVETEISETTEITETAEVSETTEPAEITNDSDEDSYDEITETKKDEDKDVYEEDNTSIKLTAKPKKKSGGFFKDLVTFGNKGKYLYPDETSSYSKNVGGALKQFAATIVVDPESEEAGFMSKNQGLYYMVFMNETSRNALKKACEQYFSDFAEKKLDRKNRKSFKAYGKTSITLRWGTLKTSTPNNGTGLVTIGYEFVGKSPYFCISIPQIINKHYEDTEAVSRYSNAIKFYFTKAQISSIIEMTSKDKVDACIQEYIISEYGVTQESDEY